jgi:fluoride exporter
MRLALAVAVLGGLGSLARWALAGAIQRRVGGVFPAGTLAVNLFGSFAIGVVMGAFASRNAESSPVRVALTAGFLGGFTTYSAFAYETWVMVERRLPLAVALNVGATLLLCLGGCAAGAFVGRALGR